jgi:hypothetical protein
MLILHRASVNVTFPSQLRTIVPPCTVVTAYFPLFLLIASITVAASNLPPQQRMLIPGL